MKTALSLFNEQGTAAVSTNHIAAELGISVGNLYWHFGDKEAIIRALFQELRESFDTAWRAPVTESDALNAAIIGLRRAFTTAWGYRFLYRELVALTSRGARIRCAPGPATTDDGAPHWYRRLWLSTVLAPASHLRRP